MCFEQKLLQKEGLYAGIPLQGTYPDKTIIQKDTCTPVFMGFPVAQQLEFCNAETQTQSLGWEDPLEEGMATHSSILAGKIPWTEEFDKL